MPTFKQRINLSIEPRVSSALKRLAQRDNTSVVSKTMELVYSAIEFEEDIVFLSKVKEREQTKQLFLTHDEVWG